MLTESKLYNEFEHYKQRAAIALGKGNIETAMEVIKLACVLAKNFYLCYADIQLEDLSVKCSRAIFNNRSGFEIKRNRDRFIFYDTHTTDNVALTQQYLAALIMWNVDFLYITTRKLDENKTKIIRQTLDKYPRATISVVPDNLSLIDTAKYIRNQIDHYDAGRAFIQTVSDDIAGAAAWNSVKNVETYYIDLSDHSFWLGTTAFDFFITFRSYGYNICLQHRGLKKEQVLVQPFYPITVSKKYKGPPVRDEASIKILSGGRLDKIYGMNDKYFELVENILKQNPNVEFLFSGGGAFGKLGQTSYIQKQIKLRHIEERFHILGFRDDIVELMRHVDIYVGTYPIGGGLMSQIAASQKLPIVQYASTGLSSSVHEFLSLKPDESFVFVNDLDGFYKEVHRLVNSVEQRRITGERNFNAVMTQDIFVVQLKSLISEKRNQYPVENYSVDCENLRTNQIDVENNCFHSFPRILVKSTYVKKNEVFKYCINLLKFIWFSDKKWVLSKLTGNKSRRYL